MRFPEDLQGLDALAVPGGESTTMSRLLRISGLEEPLRRVTREGLPCLATCAGLIVLSAAILDGRDDQVRLGALDIAVRRNAFGRQVDSFEADLDVSGLPGPPFHGVFIRAPVIESWGPDVEVIARHAGRPVAVRQGRHVGLAFHPEMTADVRIHQLFLRGVAREAVEPAA